MRFAATIVSNCLGNARLPARKLLATMATAKSKTSKEPAPEAMTAEELAETELPNQASTNAHPSSQKRPNAFTELMSQSKKSKSTKPPTSNLAKAMSALKSLDSRNGLGEYLEKPETNPSQRIVEYDDDFVVINDKYPKASVHLLLIPRKPEYYTQHPLHLLSTDAAFLAEIRTRVTQLKHIAATELRRQYGHLSAADAPYQNALEAMMSGSATPPLPESRDALLPPGRDWESEIVAGVHTHPSMNHLHIHIFSRDMASPWLKHKKHYLSFNSSFLVRIDEFPLEEGSARFHPGDWPNWDMVCWRCGRSFGNKFKALKEHLGEEFESWKVE